MEETATVQSSIWSQIVRGSVLVLHFRISTYEKPKKNILSISCIFSDKTHTPAITNLLQTRCQSLRGKSEINICMASGTGTTIHLLPTRKANYVTPDPVTGEVRVLAPEFLPLAKDLVESNCQSNESGGCPLFTYISSIN